LTSVANSAEEVHRLCLGVVRITENYRNLPKTNSNPKTNLNPNPNLKSNPNPKPLTLSYKTG